MYQNIAYHKKTGTMHVWDDDLGHKTFKFKPYGYLPDTNGEYISLNGTKLSKTPGNHRDNSDAYESDLNEEVRTLIDLYYESDLVSKGHADFFFDIETAKDADGYSTPEDVRTEITSIAYYDKVGKDRRVLVLDKANRLSDDIIYGDNYTVEVFDNEANLLIKFINYFSEIQPTVITGWNTDGYDIPYLINRIKKVLGPKSANKLSPAGIVEWNKHRERYKIFGVSSLDYIKLYKNFTYTELPNYRLDTVGKTELGKGKIEYDGDLDDLFVSDINKFIEYNMTDVDFPNEDVQALNFESNSFDIIFINHVLEHVRNDNQALKEISRILKNNGYVIITIPGNWKRMKTKVFVPPTSNGHFRDYGIDVLEKLQNHFNLVKKINLFKFHGEKHAIKKLETAFVCKK